MTCSDPTRLIHGAVLPDHVMIHPAEHGLVLVDWPGSAIGWPTNSGSWTARTWLTCARPHNQHGTWQGPFRTGHFDGVALRYAIEVTGGVDAVALTHLDLAHLHPPLRVCRSYQIGGQRLTRIIPSPERDLAYQERLTGMLLGARPVYERPGPDWPGLVEDVLDAPVALTSYGPTAADKRAVAQALRHSGRAGRRWASFVAG